MEKLIITKKQAIEIRRIMKAYNIIKPSAVVEMLLLAFDFKNLKGSLK